jgi:putative DNA primase/helicase
MQNTGLAPVAPRDAPDDADAKRRERAKRVEAELEEIASEAGFTLTFKRRRDGTATCAIIDERCPVCRVTYDDLGDNVSELRRRAAYITIPAGYLRCSRPECYCGSDNTGVTRRGRPRGLPREEWMALLGLGDDAAKRVAEIEAGLGVTIRDAPFTDAGNAERLIALHRRSIRYVPERGWMTLEPTRAIWVFDDAQMMVLATITARTTYAAAVSDESGDPLRRHARGMESMARLDAMVKLAACAKQLRVAAAALDADPWSLALLGTTIDLRTGVGRPRVREDLVTRVVPVVYDPLAECPRWLLFLREITDGDEELVGFIQRAVGYSLTGRTDEACLFLVVGPGRNGKTLLIETIRALFGPYAAAADFTTFTERRSEAARNDLARLQGIRLVTASESARGTVLDEALVKSATGGDTVSVRFLYREFFEFRPIMKVWLVSNHLPTIRGDDLGIWRRIRLIHFAKPIPFNKVDPKLGEKLLAELPGILNWAIAGAVEWHKRSLAPPDTVKVATIDYRAGMDTLGEFLATCCTLGPDLRVAATDLHAAYRKFMTAAGDRPLSRVDFATALRGRGLAPGRSSTARWWTGLALRGVTL